MTSKGCLTGKKTLYENFISQMALSQIGNVRQILGSLIISLSEELKFFSKPDFKLSITKSVFFSMKDLDSMICDEGNGESQVRCIFLSNSSFAKTQCQDSLNPLLLVKDGRRRFFPGVAAALAA